MVLRIVQPHSSGEYREVLCLILLGGLYHAHNLAQGEDWTVQVIFSSAVIELAGLQKRRIGRFLDVASSTMHKEYVIL